MKYKLSRYTVTAPCPDNNNKSILYSTRSGKMLVVTNNCIDFIHESKIHLMPPSIVERLVTIKALVPVDEDEISLVIAENNEEIEREDTLYEVIQPSSNCQLGCYYCGQKHEKGEISSEQYEKILARIREKAKARNYSRMKIGWFGAEPLMAVKTMRDLTVGLKKIAAECNIPYSAKIVTNGLSLKPSIFKELIETLSVKSVEITLDGTQEFHDQHRYTKQNERSFDLIFSNLTSILNAPDYDPSKCAVSIRCNVDNKNHEGVIPLLQLLADNNLQKKITFYTIGIYSWGNDAHKGSLTKEEFAKKEITWLSEMLRLGFEPRIIPKRVKQVCLAVSKTSEMYDAKGNIFNCTEVSYVPAYQDSPYALGNVSQDEPSPIKERPLSKWNEEVLNNKFPCHDCRMLPVCGGACPKSWHEDMRACPSAKFNIEDRLKLTYISAKKEPVLVQNHN
ncbi:MAG: SPASM domain-containing protein [Bacteroidetes bacterium]|nr:SPASM domain-containing protein [Bacteroidota bacterium]